MSEICVKYSNIESAIACSKNARDYIDDYMESITKLVNNPIGNLVGTDSKQNVSSAATLAAEKIALLSEKKACFTSFETTVKEIMTNAQTVDSTVAKNISDLADPYIEERTWVQNVGDWIYNTFCVDLGNSNDLLRDFLDGIKWIGDKIGNGIEAVRDWFKYGEGKYVWNMVSALVGAVVSVAGALAAIAAIPFSGGLSIPLVIGALGALASTVGAVITIGNSIVSAYSNGKALALSMQGETGAARYYGNVSKISEYIEKTDRGDAEDNENAENLGKKIDNTKAGADTVAFVCNIANLGVKRDYRITTRNDNVNWRHNAGKYNKGMDFSYENIKKNIMHDMGYKVSSGKLKSDAFKPNIISDDKVKKYTITIKQLNLTLKPSEDVVKFFNVTKTTKNVMDVIGNSDGLRDYVKKEEKSFSDTSKAVEKFTGLLDTMDFTSIFDKYGTGTAKTINNIISLAVQ